MTKIITEDEYQKYYNTVSEYLSKVKDIDNGEDKKVEALMYMLFDFHKELEVVKAQAMENKSNIQSNRKHLGFKS